MDESRIASAINAASFDELIKTYGNDTSNLVTTFSITSPLVISISAVTIFPLLIILQCCIPREDTDNNGQYTEQKKAAIVSFVTIGFVRLSLIVALDGSATHYTQNLFEVELKRLHHNDNTQHNILYSTPFILLALDLVFWLAYLVIVIRLAVRLIKSNVDDKGYYHLAFTLSLPIASILLHVPFIAIAYLNDANHAGSVLILYTVVTFLEFIILKFIFTQWFNLSSNSQNIKYHACLVFVIIFSLCLLYAIITISVCFFYYLPINHSISSTSNQIIIIYQTGLVFVGAVVAYKAIFETQNVFVKALDGCKNEIETQLLDENEAARWGRSTDQKKLTIFYQYIIKYAIPELRNRSRVTIPQLEGERSSGTNEGNQQGTTEICVSGPL